MFTVGLKKAFSFQLPIWLKTIMLLAQDSEQYSAQITFHSIINRCDMWKMKMYVYLFLFIIIAMPFLFFPLLYMLFRISELDMYVFVISYPKGKMTMKIRAAILLQD